MSYRRVTSIRMERVTSQSRGSWRKWRDRRENEKTRLLLLTGTWSTPFHAPYSWRPNRSPTQRSTDRHHHYSGTRMSLKGPLCKDLRKESHFADYDELLTRFLAPINRTLVGVSMYRVRLLSVSNRHASVWKPQSVACRRGMRAESRRLTRGGHPKGMNVGKPSANPSALCSCA